MLLRSDNDIDPHELTAMWFKLLGASIALILMAREAVPATQNYGARNKDCLEWTDTCVNCVRIQSGDFSCSNIGIACQPKDVTCVKRVEEKVK